MTNQEADRLKKKLELTTLALRQMMGAFDTPIAHLKMNDPFSNESRQYARDCMEDVAKLETQP